jgi:hypothetical protein
MRSFDDLPRGAFGRATPFAYPLFATNFVRHHADEFDISRGDGCYMRRPRANQLLMVIRSHGLVNMAHAEQIAATKRGDITLPWKCLRAS